MSDQAAEVIRLVADADRLPGGPAKVAVLERAAAAADRSGDDDLRYLARRDLAGAAYEAGRPDLLTVHFAWCLGYTDRHPAHDPAAVLWQYRLVIDKLPRFAEVPRAQIEAALADMAARYAAAGYSLRPVHVLRRKLYAQLGDAAAAAAAHRAIAGTAVDGLGDDRATERAFAVSHRVFRRRDADAVALAEPFVAGRGGPHFATWVPDHLLMPLARLGRAADGRRLQKRSARAADAHPYHVGTQWQHVDFLATVGDLGAAAAFDRQFGPGVGQPGRLGRFWVLKAGLFLCQRLVRAGRADVTLKVPAGLVPGAAGDRCPVPPLAAWLAAEVGAVAAAADARNGNGYHTAELARLAAQHELADRYAAGGPLPPPEEGDP